ncbi:SIR2-like domain-containing protein [Nonomuraea maritima]|uniref:SIR2-like domain-containing protein n=1 Tax=Nonomuraea maritima TaxID=683260 RepID=A0A1G9LWA8_9ACTN|nr:SIR2 family protein [Nonomuraea maritima]SDL66007.1 SIR2-like domain-containing protein [Nonomuraea maritima]
MDSGEIDCDNEAAWDLLIGDLNNGDCIPFLGAGASAERLPLGGQLAEKWAAKIHYPYPVNGNLAHVMQYATTMVYRDATRTKREFLRAHFSDVAPPDGSDRFPVHAVLARYPLPLYITTNYDDFMFRALQQARKQPAWDLCPWYAMSPDDWTRSPFRDSAYTPCVERPLVFHLHGHHDEPRSIVLIEDDYLDFLVRLAQDGRHMTASAPGGHTMTLLPSEIRTALRTKALLFIGYGLRDWTFHVMFRTLLHGLPGTMRREHASIQLNPKDHGADERRYLERYFQSQNIRILWETPRSLNDRLAAGLKGAP